MKEKKDFHKNENNFEIENLLGNTTNIDMPEGDRVFILISISN